MIARNDVVNAGTMTGAVQFGNHAADSLVNNGTINGNIQYGSGANDSLENTGTINGTVNISNGGVVDNALGGRIATANDPGAALYVNGAHTITNRGEIVAQGPGGTGIYAPGAGTISNYGSITADTAVLAVNLTATDVMTLFNYGAMTGTNAYNAGYSAASERIVNAGTMTGVVLLGNHAGDRLENSGSITGDVTFGGASGLLTNSGAINGVVTITDGFVVNETGSSIVKTSGIGSALNANGAHSLVNRGEIASQGATGVGLSTNKSGVTYNYGSITGGVAIQRGLSFTADVVTLYNYGEVMGSAAYSSINFGSSVAEWIVNAGTMTGSITLGNGNGDRLDNDGTIYGNIAVGSGNLDSLQNTGAIHGNINFAQSGSGANDRLVNDGDIYGNVVFGGGASSSVQNNGLIRGNVAMGNGNGATIVNTGTITGNVNLGAGASDYFQNRGVINGNVVLGSGAGDIFDSSPGDVFGSIFGGDGGNTLIGGRHGGGIYGGLGNDVIRGGNVDPALSGAVTFIDGGAGYNALYGGTGDTFFTGGNATLNYIQGGSGHNTVDYSGLEDVVQVRLNLHVGYVNNLLTDTIYGVQDVIGGDAGDIIIGDAFANRITAGRGYDILTGGGGADIFAYNAIAESDLANGYDQITDFQTGIDRIDISALHTNASHVQIFSGGGSTVLYTYNAVSGQSELALAFTGANVIAMGDVIF